MLSLVEHSHNQYLFDVQDFGGVGFSNIYLGGVMHPIISTTRSNFQISVDGEIGVRAVHVNLEWRSHDSLCKECHELTCPLLNTYIVATRWLHDNQCGSIGASVVHTKSKFEWTFNEDNGSILEQGYYYDQARHEMFMCFFQGKCARCHHRIGHGH